MAGRSSFNKRLKERTRQEKQREKAERRTQRKSEKQPGLTDDLDELQQHAAEQAALFHVGQEDSSDLDAVPHLARKTED